MAFSVGFGWIQQLAENDTCVGKSSLLDLVVVCHEALGLRRGEDEAILVSCCDSRHRPADRLVRVGLPSSLKAVDLDATLLLEVWAGPPTASGASAKARAKARALGEVRIPLHKLFSKGCSMLYQTWLTLDRPGAWDSVASIGLLDIRGGGSDFDQKLTDGPRQLSQPRVCVSVCRAADVSREGEVQLSYEESEAKRIAYWGALLRSQEQHLMLNAALRFQSQSAGSAQLSATPRGDDAANVDQLRHEVREQAEGLEALRARYAQMSAMLEERQAAAQQEQQERQATAQREQQEQQAAAQLRARREERAAELAWTQQELAAARQAKSDALAAAAENSAQVQQWHGANAKRREELQELRTGLQQMREDAQRRVAGAEDRVENMQKERDAARAHGDRLTAESQRLHKLSAEEEAKRKWLTEQHAALMSIIEELHRCCVSPQTRKSSKQNGENGNISTPSGAGALAPLCISSPCHDIFSKGAFGEDEGGASFGNSSTTCGGSPHLDPTQPVRRAFGGSPDLDPTQPVR